MSLDDVIYVCCLLACIGAGKYVRQIRNDQQRKMLCTTFGLLMVGVVSGLHGLHCVVSVLLGALTTLLAAPDKCHLATFVVMFGYLIFFRLTAWFGLPDPPGHTNMIQMMLTLKVSGLAFERTAAWRRLAAHEEQKSLQKAAGDYNSDVTEVTEYDVRLQQLQLSDIVHYSFSYIGVLTGPYYRYRTYCDYFDLPFRDYAPCVAATLEKLKYAGLYCALYLVTNAFYPLDYALSDVFYDDRSWVYRLMYVWPTFFIFRMRIYTGLTLSECVCTMAGFGAYPEEADVTNGGGPRKPYSSMASNPAQHTYNFTTIVNTRVRDVESCWTFREGMKHWNICVQYWLAVNVYKLFPSRKYRTAATLLVSAYWHGFRPGHYFCLMGAPFYVPLEDIWNKLVREKAEGTRRRVIDCIFWVAKFFTFSYLGTAFLLVSFANIWRFYTSVYHIGYLTWIVMMGLGVFLSKRAAAAEKRKRKADVQAGGDAADELKRD